MNKSERTRQFIIEKTAVIFNKKGYSGTSLSDITSATGLTKGSIYGNFENKEEVAVAVYEYNSALLRKGLDDAMALKINAAEKLMAMVSHYKTTWQSEFEEGGCPILNAAIEADDNLPFLKEKVKNSILNWGAKLIDIIEAGQRRGEIKDSVVAADYGYTMINLIEGGIMLGKITDDGHYLLVALDRIVKIINEELIR